MKKTYTQSTEDVLKDLGVGPEGLTSEQARERQEKYGPNKLKEGKNIAVLTLGPLGNEAAKAIASAEQKSGKSIAHYDLRFLKPLDEEMLDEIGQNYTSIVTVEDGTLKGGMGSAILEFMSDRGYTPTIRRIGIPDAFVQHGTPKELYQLCGMDAESIEKVLLSF